MTRVPSLLLLFAVAALTSCERGGQGTTAKEPPTPQQQPAVQRNVSLFFETPQLVLGAEARTLPMPAAEGEAIHTLVAALLEGPRNPALASPFPEGVTLRAAYFLPDGTAIVDLGGEPFVDGWQTGAHAEWLAIQSVAHTLTRNLPKVRQVRFVVNGQPASTLGGHIWTARSIRPVESNMPNTRSVASEATSR